MSNDQNVTRIVKGQPRSLIIYFHAPVYVLVITHFFPITYFCSSFLPGLDACHRQLADPRAFRNGGQIRAKGDQQNPRPVDCRWTLLEQHKRQHRRQRTLSLSIGATCDTLPPTASALN